MEQPKDYLEIIFGAPCAGKSRVIELNPSFIFAIPYHKFLDDDFVGAVFAHKFELVGEIAEKKNIFISVENFKRISSEVRGADRLAIDHYLWCSKAGFIIGYKQMLNNWRPKSIDECRVAMITLYIMVSLGRSWPKNGEPSTILPALATEFNLDRIMLMCTGSVYRMRMFERNHWKCRFIIGNPVRRFFCVLGRLKRKDDSKIFSVLARNVKIATVVGCRMGREMLELAGIIQE